jgi:nucleotide-binding universal stress UspA family protein
VRTVLAAVDGSPAARPVLEAALALGAMLGTAVEAIHVQDDSGQILDLVTARSDVQLREVEGPVDAVLLRALAEPNVVAGVLGARRTPGGRRPVGQTALRILEQTGTPVVVVPPDAVGVSPRAFHRLLVPLEGDEQSARVVAEGLGPLDLEAVELVALHVFTAATVPAVLDHPGRDLEMWGDEFIARFCPDAERVDLRTGAVSGRILEACSEAAADLIVLSWSQIASPGHAAVVLDVLGRSAVPVLLLPAPQVGSNPDGATGDLSNGERE